MFAKEVLSSFTSTIWRQIMQEKAKKYTKTNVAHIRLNAEKTGEHFQVLQNR